MPKIQWDSNPPLPLRGWSGGAMVLGKLPVPGRPTIWMIVGQGPIALAVGAGGGCLDIFSLLYLFSSISPSLWETARYRLKYCLKGPLNPKQPTNQPTIAPTAIRLWETFTFNMANSRSRAYGTCSRCGCRLFRHFWFRLSFLSSFSLRS